MFRFGARRWAGWLPASIIRWQAACPKPPLSSLSQPLTLPPAPLPHSLLLPRLRPHHSSGCVDLGATAARSPPRRPSSPLPLHPQKRLLSPCCCCGGGSLPQVAAAVKVAPPSPSSSSGGVDLGEECLDPAAGSMQV